LLIIFLCWHPALLRGFSTPGLPIGASFPHHLRMTAATPDKTKKPTFGRFHY
jgi:hypothetical protein